MFKEDHVIYRYKYLPFSPGSIKAITEGTIKFACPLEFNDPFDCMPYYDEDSIKNIAKNRPDLLKTAADKMGLSPAQRIEGKGKMVANIMRTIKDGSFAKGVMEDVGVVSLSKTALNILMWSHYAQFHKGFVLEFRTPNKGYHDETQYVRDRLTPFPITYDISRPVLNLFIEKPYDLIQKTLLTKSEDWIYEEEERVIDQERGAGIYSYRRDEILASIITGIKMSPENYSIIEGHVNTLKKSKIPNLALYKAKEIESEYRLTVPGHPRLDYK